MNDFVRLLMAFVFLFLFSAIASRGLTLIDKRNKPMMINATMSTILPFILGLSLEYLFYGVMIVFERDFGQTLRLSIGSLCYYIKYFTIVIR